MADQDKPQTLTVVSPAGNEYDVDPVLYHNLLAKGYKPKSDVQAKRAARLGTTEAEPETKTPAK